MRNALMEIARSGILAPSADNNHVFRIEVTDTAIRLLPTNEFSKTKDQLRRVLGVISLGSVVENMTLRAGELGFATRAAWSPDDDSGPIVVLEFSHAPNVTADILASAIANRHTNRRMYRGPQLSDQETVYLNQAVAPVDGISLVWLRGTARRRALRLIWQAESERFLRKQLHDDLFSSIRFDLSWHETANVALPPGSLEIEATMRPLFKALRHWRLMRPLSWLGVHRLIGLRAGWLPAWQAPALGILATSLPIDEAAYRTGSALERLWLQATQMGLAFQPMAAAAVLPLQSNAAEGASESLRSELLNGWQTIIPGLTPMMVFRIGRAEPPTTVSGRLPLEDYLIPNTPDIHHNP